MAIRGGYGIGYERNFGNVTFNVIQNPPNYAVISVTQRNRRPGRHAAYLHTTTWVRWLVQEAPAAATRTYLPGTSCFPNPSLRAVQQNIPTAYVQFWSGAIDYQVMKNSVLSFEYTGSKGTHEYDIANLNAGGYGSEFLGDARVPNRLNYQYSNINYRGADGFNGYNGAEREVSEQQPLQQGAVSERELHLVARHRQPVVNLLGRYRRRYYAGIPGSIQCQPGQGQRRLRHPQSLRTQRNLEHSMGKQHEQWMGAAGPWWLELLAHPEYPLGLAVLTLRLQQRRCARLYRPFYIPSRRSTRTEASAIPRSRPLLPTCSTICHCRSIPNTGAPVNAGDALAVPNCLQLDHGECSYSISGLPQGHRNAYVDPATGTLTL